MNEQLMNKGLTGNFKEMMLEYIQLIGLSEKQSLLIFELLGLISIILLAWLSNSITRNILLKQITRWIQKTKNTWDDIVFRKKFFNRVAHFAPALVIYYGIGLSLDQFPELVKIVKGAAEIYMIFTAVLVLDALLNSIHEIYRKSEMARTRPIKGYIQVVKILLYFVAGILVISLVLGESPMKLLAGLGAMAAVILLVFKDSILGFTASIQLTANKMVNVGDWITMPSHKADGDVVEIGLNTVKVQNFDKTIVTIPTYALVSESFQNWRGMEESGGRRIKRALQIDISSIKFCSPELIEHLYKIQLLKPFIDERRSEIDLFNRKTGVSEESLVNGRRMTNVGLFRKYIEQYLHNHKEIHDGMTFLVRQLQPNEYGLPIEIYVFSKEQRWVQFEDIQADIFDHLMAAIKEFELKIFQRPAHT